MSDDVPTCCSSMAHFFFHLLHLLTSETTNFHDRVQAFLAELLLSAYGFTKGSCYEDVAIQGSTQIL